MTLALPAYFYVLNAVYSTSIVPGLPPAFLPVGLLPLAVILMILRRYRRHRAPADGQDA